VKYFIILFILVGYLQPIHASANKPHLEVANNDILDKSSLQRGALIFTNHCSVCHSLKYMRYNRIAKDLNWTDEEVIQKMTFGTKKAVDLVKASVTDEQAIKVLGTKVPDLSLMSRLKGPDYIYSFLKGFKLDENQKWDNSILKSTAMPNVLYSLKNHSTTEEFDENVRDVVNFLDYVGEPIKATRWSLGKYVLIFLFILFIFTYLLKKEYWKDVK
jgi:ubiquinol-cytochrome c reductase cytochrome c1 subunit